MRHLILLPVLVALAACTPPRQACVNKVTRELATVDGLIIETQENLRRGYALDREYYTTTRVDFCFGSRRSGFGWNYCTVPDTRVRTQPVAIDRAAEQRKLNELQQTRARLSRQAEQGISQCNAQYPQQG